MLSDKLPKLETGSDEKIAEKETINKELEKDIETDNKQNKKLLTGYYNKKDKLISYDSLITLSRNINAKHHLTIDLEEVYHLSYNKDNDKPYLFDFNSNSYIEINDRILQEFLAKNENIRLNTTDTENLIKSIVKRIENNYNYIEFDNKIFNLKTYDLEDKAIKKVLKNKEYGTNKPRPFITPKRINHNILDKKDINFNPENSIVYRTLKQILGTKENIKDFKQRLGAIILNIGKDITIYYSNGGNRGKSKLIYINKLILGILARNTKPNQLKSEYNQELLDNIHNLIFDETKKHSFKDTEDYLKKITGGGTEEETRKIKAQNVIKTRINSHVTIATNELPEFNLNDTALFSRISIIELQNEFTYLNNNVDNKKIFPINDLLDEELKEDKKGLEHLIYESIKEYRLMRDKNEVFYNKKGVEYVRAFYYGNDHLINFLSVYIEVTENETEDTTPLEIANNFKQYINDNSIDWIINDDKISLEIGMKLKKLYDNIVKTDTRPIEYKNLKCTYTTQNQLGFFIDSELEDYEIYNEKHRKIFNLIKKGYNTLELLKQQEKQHNIIINAISYLKDNSYIEERTILKTN